VCVYPKNVHGIPVAGGIRGSLSVSPVQHVCVDAQSRNKWRRRIKGQPAMPGSPGKNVR